MMKRSVIVEGKVTWLMEWRIRTGFWEDRHTEGEREGKVVTLEQLWSVVTALRGCVAADKLSKLVSGDLGNHGKFCQF
jgi:hypothetical protein